MANIAESRVEFVARPGELDATCRRTYDAPRARVFQIYTDPLLIPRWWGPARLTTRVDIIETRPGGRWRYILSEPDGTEYAFFGVYHDVVTPERIVNTFEFDGKPGGVSLDTISFEEREGKTILTARSLFQSVRQRDEMFEGDAPEWLQRLADVLATQTATTGDI